MRAKALLRLALAAAALLWAGSAVADPCKAIPDHGPPPAWLKRGATFAGPVRYVGDGDSICVGESSDPNTWIEVRIADFYAPELRGPLHRAAGRLANGRRLVGRARRPWDRACYHAGGRRRAGDG